MIRQIIKIDEKKCNGCGVCARACHEGAIAMKEGKARLVREDYCDGLGDCLPACPTNAITFEEREAPAYDEAAVLASKQKQEKKNENEKMVTDVCVRSQLMQWPVQIKLAPVKAPYFEDADLLIAADCTAYAYGNFHTAFMKDRMTLIGCPKLDAGDYTEKLTEILRANAIKSVTVARMEVPCCGGLEFAVKNALQISGSKMPCTVATISTDGRILSK